MTEFLIFVSRNEVKGVRQRLTSPLTRTWEKFPEIKQTSCCSRKLIYFFSLMNSCKAATEVLTVLTAQGLASAFFR